MYLSMSTGRKNGYGPTEVEAYFPEVEAVSPPAVTEPVASTSTADTSGSEPTGTSVPELNEIDNIDPDLIRDAMEVAGLITPPVAVQSLIPPSDPIIHIITCP